MIDIPFLVIAGLFVIHMVVSQVTMHRLINKVMAGNYSGYMSAANIGKPRETRDSQGLPEPEEDLRVLNQIIS